MFSYLLQLLLLHLLHHSVLLPHCDGSDPCGHPFNEQEDAAPDDCALEGLRHASTDGEHTAGNEAGSDCVPGVVFLTVVNEKTVDGGEETAPHGEGTSQEGCSITDVHQTSHYSLTPWGIPHSYKSQLVSETMSFILYFIVFSGNYEGRKTYL